MNRIIVLKSPIESLCCSFEFSPGDEIECGCEDQGSPVEFEWLEYSSCGEMED